MKTKTNLDLLLDDLFAGREVFKEDTFNPSLKSSFEQMLCNESDIVEFLKKHEEYFLKKDNIEEIKKEWLEWLYINHQSENERLFLVYRQHKINVNQKDNPEKFIGLVVYKCVAVNLNIKEKEYLRTPVAVIRFSVLC